MRGSPEAIGEVLPGKKSKLTSGLCFSAEQKTTAEPETTEGRAKIPSGYE